MALRSVAESQPQNQGFDQWLIGFQGTTDQVVYAENMRDLRAPEAIQKALTPKILEADGPGDPDVVRDYDLSTEKLLRVKLQKDQSNTLRVQQKRIILFS